MGSKRILQLKIPKTASSSIENTLEKMNSKKIIKKIRSFGHRKPDVIFNMFKERSFIVIASIRNPYDRFLSAWKYIIENKKNKPEHKILFELKTFENFVHNTDRIQNFFAGPCKFYHLQSDWLIYNENRSYDYLIRYENLQEDWEKFTSKFKCNIKLPRIRPSKHKPWEEIYTDDMKTIVYNLYKKDFDLLGYTP